VYVVDVKKVLVLIFCIAISCKSDNNSSCDIPTQARGFGFSPLGFPNTYDQSVTFFEDVESFGNGAVMWNGSWRDDAEGGSNAGQVPEAAEVIQDASLQYCFVPVSVFGWRSGETNYIQIPSSATNDWSNVSAQAKFISMLKKFVDEYRPPYVFLGNENDFYFESNPVDYGNWINVYNAAYDAIKEVSETTLIGPVFNYEHLSGQGILNGWNSEYWQALEAHDLNRVDVVGLSTYPFLNYENPEDVPSDYLNAFFSRIGSKPVVITETGWPAEPLGGFVTQWDVSEQSQQTFIQRLKVFTSGKNIPVINWLYLNGMRNDGSSSQAWKTFGSVSVRDQNGNEYQAFNEWIQF
jgi:hypothetical protein